MKNSITPINRFMMNFPKYILAGYIIFFSGNRLVAQCNVNEKYDKIISGYHSSFAVKDDGTYAVWGSGMSATGATDVLSPTDVNSTNYSGLTGTVLKAAVGGSTSNSRVDQAILLTTTGLWAWGIAGNVISSSYTTSAAFQRIISPAGATALGLPTGVAPADVASLFVTYQTIVLLTTTGNVWILTQTSLALEGNGGAAATAGSSTWKQVKINSTTNLTNVTAVRGQVSSITYNAFMALTSTGQVYTWGNSTYTGNATASAARNYATLMTLPAEFTSSNIPKMIGVTGGIATTATTKNTCFLLSNSGSLYSLGDNTQKQCGDFTTTERLSWVNAKISAAVNFTNVNFISVQEANSSFPGVVAVTTSGDMYTWGNNSSSMIGRTDDGTSTGTLSVSYDPGKPVIFTPGTDKAISAEIGGHTLVYLKAGSTQFCYVGHRTNGSMGDGSATTSTNGGYYATCNSTPSLNICGSVPVAASTANSTISASTSSIRANGTSTSTITIQLKNSSGTNLTTSGGPVTATTTAGTLGTVTDNNNGTYTVTFTSSSTPGTATISFAVFGTTATGTTSVIMTATLPVTWINISAYRQGTTVKITWATATETNVKRFMIERSLNGLDWSMITASIPVAGTATATKNYAQTDTAYNTKRLLYRVKQEDMDGRYTYSPVVTVTPVSEVNTITIYPVPAESNFHLGNIDPGKIKRVQLSTVTGSILKNWNLSQSAYDIQGIPSGTYIIRVETNNGTQILKLKK